MQQCMSDIYIYSEMNISSHMQSYEPLMQLSPYTLHTSSCILADHLVVPFSCCWEAYRKPDNMITLLSYTEKGMPHGVCTKHTYSSLESISTAVNCTKKNIIITQSIKAYKIILPCQ